MIKFEKLKMLYQFRIYQKLYQCLIFLAFQEKCMQENHKKIMLYHRHLYLTLIIQNLLILYVHLLLSTHSLVSNLYTRYFTNANILWLILILLYRNALHSHLDFILESNLSEDLHQDKTPLPNINILVSFFYLRTIILVLL